MQQRDKDGTERKRRKGGRKQPVGRARCHREGYVGADGNRKLVRKSRRGRAVLEDKPVPH